MQAFDPRVHAGRPDASQQGVARRLMALLVAGGLGAGAGAGPVRACGPCRRCTRRSSTPWSPPGRRCVVEVDDSTENPLVAADGTPLHHGGFVTARLSATLDALRQATYPVIALSAARLSALINPSLTGLPAFLASGPAGSSGVMILEYLAQDALARARILTTPVSTGHASVSLGLEEHASFSTQAVWASEQMVELAPVVLGCELVAAVRALRMDPGRLPDDPRPCRCTTSAAAVLGRGPGRPSLHRRPRRRRTPGRERAS